MFEELTEESNDCIIGFTEFSRINTTLHLNILEALASDSAVVFLDLFITYPLHCLIEGSGSFGRGYRHWMS
jgi:hypothetical protein